MFTYVWPFKLRPEVDSSFSAYLNHFLPYILRQDPSRNLDLTNLSSLTNPSFCLLTLEITGRLQSPTGFYMCVGHLNSGVRACMRSSSSTEPFPRSSSFCVNYTRVVQVPIESSL